MISVVLCTHNGAAYLKEQLQSLANQSRRPGELVAVDDGSEDATVDLLREFERAAPFPVRTVIHAQNRGSTRSFDEGIRLARGDLIALSDQDDVWLPTKLEKLSAILQTRPDAGLAFSDATLVDPRLKPLGRSLWESVGLSPRILRALQAGDAFACLARRNAVTGATAMFRASLREAVLPIPESWVHDAWIALVVSARAGLAPIAEQLVLYRQHPGQQIGAPDRARRRRVSRNVLRRDLESMRRHLIVWEPLRERLAGPGWLDGMVRHWNRRVGMPREFRLRIGRTLTELVALRYHRHSSGFRGFLKDLFFSV